MWKQTDFIIDKTALEHLEQVLEHLKVVLVNQEKKKALQVFDSLQKRNNQWAGQEKT